LCQIAGKSTKKNGDYLVYKEFLKQRQESVKDISTFELCYALNEIANEVIDEIEKSKGKLSKAMLSKYASCCSFFSISEVNYNVRS
jgi:hypothetical protein